MVYKVTPVKENSILYTFQVDGMMSAKMNFLTPPHSYFFLCSLLRFCFECGVGVGEPCVTLRGRLGVLQATSAASS